MSVLDGLIGAELVLFLGEVIGVGAERIVNRLLANVGPVVQRRQVWAGLRVDECRHVLGLIISELRVVEGGSEGHGRFHVASQVGDPKQARTVVVAIRPPQQRVLVAGVIGQLLALGRWGRGSFSTCWQTRLC